jgi:hypothetical protein
MDKQITIQMVKGGFILHTCHSLGQSETEVFTSPAKLLKAVKAALGDDADKTDKVAE